MANDKNKKPKNSKLIAAACCVLAGAGGFAAMAGAGRVGTAFSPASFMEEHGGAGQDLALKDVVFDAAPDGSDNGMELDQKQEEKVSLDEGKDLHIMDQQNSKTDEPGQLAIAAPDGETSPDTDPGDQAQEKQAPDGNGGQPQESQNAFAAKLVDSGNKEGVKLNPTAGNNGQNGDSGSKGQGAGSGGSGDKNSDGSGSGVGNGSGTGTGETTSPTGPSDSGATEPSSPAEPEKPTDPAESSSPITPTDPATPTNPVAPTEPVSPTEPVKPTDPVAPTDPVQPTEPEKDPDADKYAPDYTDPGTVDGKHPNVEEGECVELTVTGSLMQHFFIDESPSITDMSNYIHVTAKMKDGKVYEDLVYKADGVGDYMITWPEEAGSRYHYGGFGMCPGTVPGQYEATITYGGKSVKVPYDVVDWQVKLCNFKDSDVEFEEQTISVDYDHRADISAALADMRSVIEKRTEDGKDSYVNVNAQGLRSKEYLSCFFGGWAKTEGTADSVGSSYRMSRPTTEQIDEHGVYQVKLYPIWVDENMELNDCHVIMDSNTYRIGIYSYVGNSDTIEVPGIVDWVDPWQMFYGRKSELEIAGTGDPDNPYPNVTKIILPESVTAFKIPDVADNRNTFPKLTEMEVANSNQSYMTIDGVLYNKTGKTLVYWPAAKTSIKKWSKTVNTIGEGSFAFTDLVELKLPETVISLDRYAFAYAGIDRLEITAEKMKEIGELPFFSDLNLVKKGVRVIQFDCQEVPEANDKTFDEMDDLVQILVPDSEHDALYKNYVKTWAPYLDAVYNPNHESGGGTDIPDDPWFPFSLRYTGLTPYMLVNAANLSGEQTDEDTEVLRGMDVSYQWINTPAEAKLRYATEGGSLMSADKTVLAAVPWDYEGEYVTPESTEKILSDAFSSCGFITTMTLEYRVQELGEGCLKKTENLSALNALTILSPKLLTMNESTFSDSFSSSLKIYVPQVLYDSYLAECETDALKSCLVPTGDAGVIEENGCTYVQVSDGLRLVQVLDTYSGVYIAGDDVTEIGDGAFTNCWGLTGVVFPDHEIRLGHKIFNECWDISMIVFNGLTAPQTESDTFEGGSWYNTQLYYSSKADSSYNGAAWSGFAEENRKTDWSSYQIQRADEAVQTSYVLYGQQEEGLELILSDLEFDGSLELLPGTRRILPEAFMYRGGLTEVTGATEVAEIGDAAFSGCRNLSRIQLSETGAITLGKGCFEGCMSLTQLSDNTGGSDGCMMLPAGITELPERTFADCYSLNEVHISSPVKSIGDSCFDSSTLATLSFEPAAAAALESVGDRAFYWTDLELVNWRNYYSMTSLKTIGEEAFARCFNLKYVYLPNQITEIGEASFKNCNNMIGVQNNQGLWYFYMPSAMKKIPDHMFEGCTSLPGILLQGNLEEIGESSMEGCASLKYFQWTNMAYAPALTTIGARAFAECSALKGMNVSGLDFTTMAFWIPERVTSIGEQAFSGCSGLNGVFIKDSEVDWGEAAGGQLFEGCDSLVTIFCNAKYLPTILNGKTEYPVRSLSFWGDAESVDFTGCEGLEIVRIGRSDEATSIADHTFAEFPNLQSVYLNAKIEKLGDGCFEKCEALTSLSIAASFTEIPDDWCKDCTNLKSLTWNANYYNTVERIGKSAFENCAELRNTGLLGQSNGNYFKNLREIDDCAYKNCSNLTIGEKSNATHIPNTVTALGEECFSGCGMTQIFLYGAVKEMGRNCFTDCKNLEKLWVMGKAQGEESTVLGEEAFLGCERLNTVNVNGYIQRIEKSAFADCKALSTFCWYTSAYTGSLTDIGDYAFQNCTALTGTGDIKTSNLTDGAVKGMTGAVVFRGTNNMEEALFSKLETIGDGAFSGCSGLRIMSIPDSVTELSDELFKECEKLESCPLSDNLERIGAESFASCRKLKEVRIPYELTELGDLAFSGDTGITKVTLNQLPDLEASNAFQGCSGIEDLILGAELVVENGELDVKMLSCFDGAKTLTIQGTIGSLQGSFSDWKHLTTVTGDHDAEITELGKGLFEGASALSTVELNCSIGAIGDRCFKNCTSLETVKVCYEDEGKLPIGTDAFEGCPDTLEFYINDELQGEEEQALELPLLQAPTEMPIETPTETLPEDPTQTPGETEEGTAGGATGGASDGTTGTSSGSTSGTSSGNTSGTSSGSVNDQTDGETADGADKETAGSTGTEETDDKEIGDKEPTGSSDKETAGSTGTGETDDKGTTGSTEGSSDKENTGSTEGGSDKETDGSTEGGSDKETTGSTEGGSDKENTGSTEGSSDKETSGSTEGSSDKETSGSTEEDGDKETSDKEPTGSADKETSGASDKETAGTTDKEPASSEKESASASDNKADKPDTTEQPTDLENAES